MKKMLILVVFVVFGISQNKYVSVAIVGDWNSARYVYVGGKDYRQDKIWLSNGFLYVYKKDVAGISCYSIAYPDHVKLYTLKTDTMYTKRYLRVKQKK